MNCKLFLVACINAAALCFPYNIIGCAGGDDDPYDYYVSFFAKDNTNVPGYQPFYYTNVQFLYREEEPVKTSDVTSAEWVGYGNNSFSKKDANDFVVKFARKDLSNLYFHLEKNQPLSIPDSVKNNGMTNYFMQNKDLEALGYIMYAKQVEPNVTGDWTAWEPIQRDKDKMAKLQKNGNQLYAVAKNDFIKLRLAYQVARLAHYAGRYDEAIQAYDQQIKPNPTKSILQDLGLSLKAGALMHTGQKNEAAYIFSQLFSKEQVKRISNYMSFDWSVKRFDEANRKAVLALCKNDLEKANLLGLFALGSFKPELNTLKTIQKLAPSAPMFEILLIREVNKLEDNYFAPGGKSSEEVTLNSTNISENSQEVAQWRAEAKEFGAFCQDASKQKGANKNLLSVAAAHAFLISGDFASARKQLDDTKKLNLSSELQDQWGMTNLLLTINTQPTIDQKFEEQIYPSLQWLQKKAEARNEYAQFYRRVFNDVLAPRYKALKNADQVKFLLCQGTAEWIQQKYIHEGWGFYSNTVGTLRTEFSSEQVQQLINLMSSSKLNSFEKFIVSNNTFSKDDVNDVAGTSLLREFKYAEAEKWFAKIPASYYTKEPYATYLLGNPFADLIEDTHAPTKQDTKKYTKLTFTQRMMQLEKDLAKATDPEKQAQLHYEIAKGLYGMSYWGNSWILSQYGWGGGEGLPSDTKSLKPGEKEYYGVFSSRDHYLQAFNLSKDKNFKARSLFMVAKCEQKQIPVPQWGRNMEWDTYSKLQKEHEQKIMTNKVRFTALAKEYNTTPFFKEAINTCSYLGDFVRRIK
ncbi:hypothetical protein HHL16_06215 [Pseudoflavitalea sp. G-6-1-2]|uniref:hypothetical protein n=1 Tax=Pseudoflavitalea sp. G-6-1-2 TaxID=2728841 RepID=UPI00146CAE54|nr:hypothetical protein [Pseudoflavitalea sp. G-6-1-2]NML20458.1 hypothetical protein [Pseudoflavitalea sp. G-6-1-2]